MSRLKYFIFLFFCAIGQNRAMIQNLKEKINAVATTIQNFYNSGKSFIIPIQSAKEVENALLHYQETTFVGRLPTELRKELIKYAATQEFKKIFETMLPTILALNSDAPDHQYIQYLLKIGANPNVLVAADTTAIDIINAINAAFHATNLSLITPTQVERKVAYTYIGELIKKHGGKAFSEFVEK